MVVCMSGVPRTVLAAMAEEGAVRCEERLDVKGEEPSVCCCCLTITAESRGELEVTGSAELPTAPCRNAPLPSSPIDDTSPASVAEDTVDIPIAPISIPPPPPDEDTRPPADIHEGRFPPGKLSPAGVEELGNDGNDGNNGNDGAISNELGFGLDLSLPFP